MCGKSNQQDVVLYPRSSHAPGLKEPGGGEVSNSQGE